MTNFPDPKKLYLNPHEKDPIKQDAVIRQIIQILSRQSLLTANTTFFVNASTGSDTNNGLTANSAFATLQGAFDSIQGRYVLGPPIPPATVGPVVTISVAAGTYTTGLNFGGPLIGQTDISQLLITGPSSAIISVNGNPAGALYFEYGAMATVDGGITLQNTNGNAIYAFGATVNLKNVTYGPCSGAGISTSHVSARDGSVLLLDTSYTITGGASQHFRAAQNSLIRVTAPTITLTGTPAFATSFVNVFDYGVVLIPSSGTSFSGSATGSRWQIGVPASTVGGAIDTASTFAADQNYFPGNAAGTATAPGIFNDTTFTGNLEVSGSFGYLPSGAGTGGAVTQLTSKNTNVTINKICGQITTSNSALLAGAQAGFTVSNNLVTATDVVVFNLQGGAANTAAYEYAVTQVNSGIFTVYIINVSGGSLSEALVFNFAVIKAVAT